MSEEGPGRIIQAILASMREIREGSIHLGLDVTLDEAKEIINLLKELRKEAEEVGS